MKKLSMLIIDGNNWFRRRAETDPYGNPVRECYKEIQRSQKDVVICVWDGVNSLKARRDIYPAYKVGRKFAGEDFFAIQKQFKEIVQLSKAVSIEVPEYEGDDVIAHLVYKYRSEFEILIESNDADLAQLNVNMTRTIFKIPAEDVALYKTLVGDSSDKIPGLKGFGEKAWQSLTLEQKRSIYTSLELLDLQAWPEDVKITEEQFSQLLIFWRIVNFLPLEGKLVDKHSIEGLNRPDLAEDIFKQFMS